MFQKQSNHVLNWKKQACGNDKDLSWGLRIAMVFVFAMKLKVDMSRTTGM